MEVPKTKLKFGDLVIVSDSQGFYDGLRGTVVNHNIKDFNRIFSPDGTLGDYCTPEAYDVRLYHRSVGTDRHLLISIEVDRLTVLDEAAWLDYEAK